MRCPLVVLLTLTYAHLHSFVVIKPRISWLVSLFNHRARFACNPLRSAKIRSRRNRFIFWKAERRSSNASPAFNEFINADSSVLHQNLSMSIPKPPAGILIYIYRYSLHFTELNLPLG